MLFMLYDCKCFMYVMYFISCYMYLPITLKGYICAVNKILFYSILFYSILNSNKTRYRRREPGDQINIARKDKYENYNNCSLQCFGTYTCTILTLATKGHLQNHNMFDHS